MKAQLAASAAAVNSMPGGESVAIAVAANTGIRVVITAVLLVISVRKMITEAIARTKPTAEALQVLRSRTQ